MQILIHALRWVQLEPFRCCPWRKNRPLCSFWFKTMGKWEHFEVACLWDDYFSQKSCHESDFEIKLGKLGLTSAKSNPTNCCQISPKVGYVSETFPARLKIRTIFNCMFGRLFYFYVSQRSFYSFEKIIDEVSHSLFHFKQLTRNINNWILSSVVIFWPDQKR